MLTVGGAALAGGIGSAVMVSGTADRAAAASADLEVAGHETTIRNGSIEAVWLTATVAWTYALPSGENPATAIVELQAGEALETVATRETDAVFLENNGEESIDVDLLAEDVLSAGEIRPSDSGETIESVVDLGVAFRVESEDGTVLAVDKVTTTAPLSITESDYNASKYGDVAGSGELTVELS